MFSYLGHMHELKAGWLQLESEKRNSRKLPLICSISSLLAEAKAQIIFTLGVLNVVSYNHPVTVIMSFLFRQTIKKNTWMEWGKKNVNKITVMSCFTNWLMSLKYVTTWRNEQSAEDWNLNYFKVYFNNCKMCLPLSALKLPQEIQIDW